MLGCDHEEGSKGAINWVNKNIINVAVTRAKYRIYFIGDYEAWSNNRHFSKSEEIKRIKFVNS